MIQHSATGTRAAFAPLREGGAALRAAGGVLRVAVAASFRLVHPNLSFLFPNDLN